MIDNLTECLTVTPKEDIKHLKAKLSALKRTQRFSRWGESGGLARKLRNLLEEIQAGVDDPRTGAELVAVFYGTDQGTLGHCDDSSGLVGDVYRYDAKDWFVVYASRCADKDWLGELVFKVSRDDDYGVRDALIDCAAEYLPEPVIRTLIAHFQKLADHESDECRGRHWLYRVESLARQIKDAPLFETTRLAAWGNLSTAACVDIAQVCLESDEVQTALVWLERISEQETFQARERDQLLLDIYDRLEDAEKRAEVAWRIFRRSRSTITLAQLLTVVGEGQRETLLAGEGNHILSEPTLSLIDAVFLVEIEFWDAAEAYLLDRREQFNGDFYERLLPLAEILETAGRPLVASMLYRALLDSILRRAQTRTYSHGILPDHHDQLSHAELRAFSRMCRRFEKYLQQYY